MPQSNISVLKQRSQSSRAIAVSARDAQIANRFRAALLALVSFMALAMTMAAFLATSAQADDAQPSSVPVELEAKMHSIISAQIDAFRSEDAETAYSFASPAIKRMYTDPDNFISMVQRGYPAVYSPQSFEFIESAITPRGPAQMVEFIAEDGQIWGGIYTFFEGSEGDLSISGVYLRRQEGQQI